MFFLLLDAQCTPCNVTFCTSNYGYQTNENPELAECRVYSWGLSICRVEVWLVLVEEIEEKNSSSNFETLFLEYFQNHIILI